jgi:hypothetical protein
MRTGTTAFLVAVSVSVILHVMALIGVGLSAGPKSFEAPPTETVTVDIVTPDESPAKPEPEPLKGTDLLPAAAAAPPPPTPRSSRQAQDSSPAASRAEPAPQAAQPQPRTTQPQPRTAQAQAPARSPFDPTALAEMFRVSPVAPDETTASEAASVSGFDTPAGKTANLSPADVAAFKAHLRKCLTLPTGVSKAENLRVVFRIALRPDGALGGQPTLIEATASPNGPVMVQSVSRALRECQPYSFLPPDKYAEWRVLDLSLTPRDLVGG